MESRSKKRKILVIGKLRIKLPRFSDFSFFDKDKAAESLRKVPAVFGSLRTVLGRSVSIVGHRIPLAFFLVCILVIVPIGVVFGQEKESEAGTATGSAAVSEADAGLVSGAGAGAGQTDASGALSGNGDAGDDADDDAGDTGSTQPADTDSYEAGLSVWVKKADRDKGGLVYNTFYNDDVNDDAVSVKSGDTILYRVDVYNKCFKDIVVTDLTVQIPAGLAFDASLSIAHIDPAQPAYTNSDWEIVSGTYGAQAQLKYTGDPIRLYPWDGTSVYPEYRLPLVLTVSAAEDVADGTMLSVSAKISNLLTFAEEPVADADMAPGADMNDDTAVSYSNPSVVDEHFGQNIISLALAGR